jgi:hypothetical protein
MEGGQGGTKDRKGQETGVKTRGKRVHGGGIGGWNGPLQRLDSPDRNGNTGRPREKWKYWTPRREMETNWNFQRSVKDLINFGVTPHTLQVGLSFVLTKGIRAQQVNNQ